MADKIQGLIERQKQLLWDVSHELRTPLTRIALAIGLLRQRSKEAAPAELVRIDREIERLNNLIGEILIIARLEAGNSTDTASREYFDLSALLEKTTEESRIETDARSVSLRLECDASLHVVASRELLRVAVENVLRNAIRHTPTSSSVCITLLQEGNQALLSICDESPGVKECDLPHLFDPFFRSEDARLKHPNGFGLGLAMVHRIVEWHGGSLSACNRESGGLVVKILLPLAESPNTEFLPDCG